MSSTVRNIEPGWYSMPGAAKYTGFTEPTIRKAIDLGKLPKKEVRLDGPDSRASIRIKRAHLDDWIEGKEISQESDSNEGKEIDES